MNKETYVQIMDLETEQGEWTIRDYLFELLDTMYREGEGFSGKRPFGDSGWKYDLYPSLVESSLVEGSLDQDGYIQEINTTQADQIILDLIGHTFYGFDEE